MLHRRRLSLLCLSTSRRGSIGRSTANVLERHFCPPELQTKFGIVLRDRRKMVREGKKFDGFVTRNSRIEQKLMNKQ